MLLDPGIAFLLYFAPAAPDNRTRKSAAMRQALIGGIHDRFHLFFSQITLIERERLAGMESELINKRWHRKIVTTKAQRHKGTKPRPTRSASRPLTSFEGLRKTASVWYGFAREANKNRILSDAVCKLRVRLNFIWRLSQHPPPWQTPGDRGQPNPPAPCGRA